MNSMTMHILGGLVHAAMNSTTFGCRRAVITRTYLRHTVHVSDVQYNWATIRGWRTNLLLEVALSSRDRCRRASS